MKKEISLRGFHGITSGIAIGYIITIIFSLIFANGYYSPCVPGLIERMGSEIGAVILQTILCGVIGGSFAATSVIWNLENWSLQKQTVIYFSINAIVSLSIAYLLGWMVPSVSGFILYFSIFIAIFLVIWILIYSYNRNIIKKMNQELVKKR